ncbi:hypothetical protein M3Y99_00075600 [Aphelenchoides fujianensis]|nr:hypothetical protein M3Y99_00075600 [Aphelenchoides fujianensis]
MAIDEKTARLQSNDTKPAGNGLPAGGGGDRDRMPPLFTPACGRRLLRVPPAEGAPKAPRRLPPAAGRGPPRPRPAARAAALHRRAHLKIPHRLRHFRPPACHSAFFRSTRVFPLYNPPASHIPQ